MRQLLKSCWVFCLISWPLYVWCADPVPTAAEYYGPVQANDTLWSIATRLRPSGVGTKQMVIALQYTNPDAFAGGNVNKLIAGYTLRIPNLGEIRNMSVAQANTLFQQQLADPTIVRLPVAAEPESSDNHPAAEPADEVVSLPTEAVATQDITPATVVEHQPKPMEAPGIEQWHYVIGSCLVISLIVWLLWRRFRREAGYPSDLSIPVTKPQPVLKSPSVAVQLEPAIPLCDTPDDNTGGVTQPTLQQPYNIAALNANAGLDKPLDDLEVAFELLSAEETPAPVAQSIPVHRDPVDDHIALASAYRDLGDTKSARELLEEAQQIGNPDQQQRATAILMEITTQSVPNQE